MHDTMTQHLPFERLFIRIVWIAVLWMVLVAICFYTSPVFGQSSPASGSKSAVPKGVEEIPDLEYAHVNDQSLLLDLYLPEKTTSPLPVIVWIHGGGWRNQSRKQCPAIPLTKDGYAVASVDYRLSNVAIFPAQIEDCKAAIRWLRANAEKYHLDPDRIGVWGRSAGGHLVALLGTCGDTKEWDQVGGNLEQSSRVQAVCDWFGPTDFSTMPKVVARTDGLDSVELLFGAKVKDVPKLAASAGPINHVSSNAPPFLIMHGDQDHAVPLEQSERFAEALKNANVDVTFKVVKGADHGFPGFDLNKLIESDVHPFFDKYLKK